MSGVMVGRLYATAEGLRLHLIASQHQSLVHSVHEGSQALSWDAYKQPCQEAALERL